MTSFCWLFADFEFSEPDSTSGTEASGGSLAEASFRRAGGELAPPSQPRRSPHLRLTSAGGIVNPAFMPDLDPIAQVQIPPWLEEAELDRGAVAPSQRAQLTLPWTPSSLHRLAPPRSSTSSTQVEGQARPPPPPPTDNEHM